MHSEGSCTRGRPWSEIEAVSAPYNKAVALAACRQPGAVGESRIWGRRGKTPWGKPVSAINTVKEKSGSVALRPVEIPPSPAYGAFPPHTCVQTRVPGKSCAVPGRHNLVGQMSLAQGKAYFVRPRRTLRTEECMAWFFLRFYSIGGLFFQF